MKRNPEMAPLLPDEEDERPYTLRYAVVLMHSQDEAELIFQTDNKTRALNYARMIWENRHSPRVTGYEIVFGIIVVDLFTNHPIYSMPGIALITGRTRQGLQAHGPVVITRHHRGRPHTSIRHRGLFSHNPSRKPIHPDWRPKGNCSLVLHYLGKDYTRYSGMRRTDALRMAKDLLNTPNIPGLERVKVYCYTPNKTNYSGRFIFDKPYTMEFKKNPTGKFHVVAVSDTGQEIFFKRDMTRLDAVRHAKDLLNTPNVYRLARVKVIWDRSETEPDLIVFTKPYTKGTKRNPPQYQFSMESGERCDFCSGKPIKWRLMALTDEITVPDISLQLTSVGDWAACDPCYKIIRRKDKGALIRRSWNALMARDPVLRKTPGAHARIRQELIRIQNMFWRNWTGLVEPVEGN